MQILFWRWPQYIPLTHVLTMLALSTWTTWKGALVGFEVCFLKAFLYVGRFWVFFSQDCSQHWSVGKNMYPPDLLTCIIDPRRRMEKRLWPCTPLWEPEPGKENTTFCSLYFYLQHDKPVHQDLYWLLIDFGSAINLNGSQLRYLPALAHYPLPLFCSVVVGNVLPLSENDLCT